MGIICNNANIAKRLIDSIVHLSIKDQIITLREWLRCCPDIQHTLPFIKWVINNDKILADDDHPIWREIEKEDAMMENKLI